MHRVLLAAVLAAILAVIPGQSAASDGARPVFPAQAILFSGPGLPDGTFAEYAVNASGSGLERLPVAGLLSPDGELVAFVRCRTNCTQAYAGYSVDDLFVSAVDGTATRRVGTWKAAETSAGISWAPDDREDPSWAPSGKKIVASSERRGLVVFDLAGKSRVVVPFGGSQPAWQQLPTSTRAVRVTR